MSVQFFVEPDELQAGRIVLKGAEAHYLRRVRRLEVGDWALAMDGQGRRAEAEIKELRSSEIVLELAVPEEVEAPSFKMHFAPALIKGERMDQALSKLVELGAWKITPLLCQHCVVRLDAKRARQRHQRYQKLVSAALRQSRNPFAPSLEEISSFSSLISSKAPETLGLIPHLGRSEPLMEVLPEKLDSVLVLIGPEGGFSEAEGEEAIARGFVPVSLGPRILRAETASIAIAAILNARYGDVGSR